MKHSHATDKVEIIHILLDSFFTHIHKKILLAICVVNNLTQRQKHRKNRNTSSQSIETKYHNDFIKFTVKCFKLKEQNKVIVKLLGITAKPYMASQKLEKSVCNIF